MSTELATRNDDYLPHIDGIRAIAFSVVFLFHFKVPGFSNGFLGVDMFLVISGFLMTRIIDKDVKTGDFSLMKFMKKRFWRLYPAFIATVAFTLIGGTLIFSKRLMDDLTKSTAAAALFLSNIYYSKDYRYFGLRSQYRPLLHTWSLSLEEQFYLVWPSLLLFYKYYVGRLFRSAWCYDVYIGSLTLISVSVNLLFASNHKNFVFYWLPSRFYEFLIGAIISSHYQNLKASKLFAQFHNLFSALGIASIYFSVMSSRWKTTTTIIPNLISCVGTSLLILSPNSAFSRFVLNSSPFRLLGKLSYAAYLTHWPIWVLFGTYNAFLISGFQKALLLASTMVSALILRKFVEEPFRNNNSKTRSIFLVFTLALIFMLVKFSWSISDDHAKSYLDEWKLKRYSALSCKKLPRKHTIFQAFGATEPLPQNCAIGHEQSDTSNLNFSAVLIGSSFAEHLVPGLRLIAAEKNATFLVLSSKNCAYQPISSSYGFEKFPYTAEWCIEENTRRNKLLRSMNHQHILLADFILLRFAGFGFRVQTGRDVLEHPTKGAFVYFKSVCKTLIDQGHSVSFLGDTPFISYEAFEGVLSNVKLQKWLSIGNRKPLESMLNWRFSPHAQHFETNEKVMQFFKVEELLQECKMFDMMPEFCKKVKGKMKCQFFDSVSHDSLYTDGAHLSTAGSWKARKTILNTVLEL